MKVTQKGIFSFESDHEAPLDVRQEGNFSLEVILDIEDIKKLDGGASLMNANHKVAVHRVYAFDPQDYESRVASREKQPYGRINRETSFVDIHIPHGILRDAEVRETVLSTKLNNLSVIPDHEPSEDYEVRILYPEPARQN